MPFLQFTLDVGARNPEPYEDALFALGALSVTLLDAADDPVLEPLPGVLLIVDEAFGGHIKIGDCQLPIAELRFAKSPAEF